MATRTEIIVYDDLTGEEIAADTAVTVPLVVEGRAYELDLSPASRIALMDALEPFISSATPVKRAVQPHKVNGRSSSGDRALSRAVREWARGAGKPVQDRGRVSAELVAEYRAVQSHTPAIREAVEAVNPPGDGLDQMRVVTLRQLAAERGGSSMTRASKPALLAWLRAHPEGTPAAKATRAAGEQLAQNRVAKPASKPAEATAAPDLSRYTAAQRKEYTDQVRAWAKHHGGTVKDKGRMSPAVFAAYEAQNPDLLPKG